MISLLGTFRWFSLYGFFAFLTWVFGFKYSFSSMLNLAFNGMHLERLFFTYILLALPLFVLLEIINEILLVVIFKDLKLQAFDVLVHDLSSKIIAPFVSITYFFKLMAGKYKNKAVSVKIDTVINFAALIMYILIIMVGVLISV